MAGYIQKENQNTRWGDILAMNIFKRIYELMNRNDPVKCCEIYKTIGCSHVDGLICDMKTCKELKQWRNNHDES